VAKNHVKLKQKDLYAPKGSIACIGRPHFCSDFFYTADQFKVIQAIYGGTLNAENNEMCSLGANM
jgi:hypothetical protein